MTQERRPYVGQIVHYRQRIGNQYQQCHPALVTHVDHYGARLLIFWDAENRTSILSHAPAGDHWHYVEDCDGATGA